MAFVKIENGIVIQKSCSHNDGFIEVSDDVVCGQIQQGTAFVNQPPTPMTAEQLIQMEMPTVQDQLDALFAGGAEMATMKNKIAAIKEKHQK